MATDTVERRYFITETFEVPFGKHTTLFGNALGAVAMSLMSMATTAGASEARVRTQDAKYTGAESGETGTVETAETAGMLRDTGLGGLEATDQGDVSITADYAETEPDMAWTAPDDSSTEALPKLSAAATEPQPVSETQTADTAPIRSALSAGTGSEEIIIEPSGAEHGRSSETAPTAPIGSEQVVAGTAAASEGTTTTQSSETGAEASDLDPGYMPPQDSEAFDEPADDFDTGWDSGTDPNPEPPIDTGPHSEIAPTTLVAGGAPLDIAGGRVTTLELDSTGPVSSIRIVEGPEFGNATVNPDNSIALVMSDNSYAGPLSMQIEVTHADGSTELMSADFNVAAPTQDAGWGAGNHYMLETDANGDVVVETGDNHRKVFVSESVDALTKADIAALEGLVESAITTQWLIDHPEYGGSEDMALATGPGMDVWYGITGRETEPSSNWLLFERGYEYTDIGRVIDRGTEGEDELHPIHVTSFGEGARPVIESELRLYQDPSSNIVFSDLEFSEGVLALDGNGFLFENVLFTDNEVNVQNINALTFYSSEFLDITTDAPKGDTGEWQAHLDRTSGLFGSNIDGLLIEGSLFDHNAWVDGYDGTPENGQPPSMYSHNVYLQNNTTDVTFRDSITMQGASFGAQFRGGVFAEDNVFLDNNVAVNFLGGDYKDAGPIGNFSLFTSNVITSGAHKDAVQIGGLTMGVENKGVDSTLLYNIIAHLADPNNPDELAWKTVTHDPLYNANGTFHDDTIIFNWMGSDPNNVAIGARDGDQNVEGLDASVLNQTTIQNFAAALLGDPNATISDLADYLRSLPDTGLADSVTADDIVAYFQAGFGVEAGGDGSATYHHFIPDALADGIRWDNRLNWSSEELPDFADSVDLGGNWVNYGGTTILRDLDLGDGGRLTVGQGKLTVAETLETGGTKGAIIIDGAGQFWANGYGGTGTLSLDVNGGRFANTGDVTGQVMISASDGQVLLGVDNASFDLAPGSELRIEGSGVKLGFDGSSNGTSVLHMAENSVLTFDADATGVSTLQEFRSGALGEGDPAVLSGVALDGSLQIDLADYAGGPGRLDLIATDALTGALDDIRVFGLDSTLDAVITIDYEADALWVQLLGGGTGTASLTTIGAQSDLSDEAADLQTALTSGRETFDDAVPLVSVETGVLEDIFLF